MQRHQHVMTLAVMLLLLLQQASTTATAQQTRPAEQQQHQGEDEPADSGGDLPASDFSAAQLASARTRLSDLFDAAMDADRDGKLTRRELTAWLAAVARQQAESDLDEAWAMYTAAAKNSSSSNDTDLLDWDTYASARATAAAGYNDGDSNAAAANMAGLQAEVRRAIDEASKETGLDKAGIKVSVPTAPAQPPPSSSSSQQQQQQQQLHQEQLAMELAKDRRRWEAADADGDGRLSRGEFRDFAFADSTATAARMRPVLALEALERMDANGDGRVSLVEFLAVHGGGDGETATAKADDAKNFRQVWDANKDGYMDAEEMGKMLDYLDSSAATATATSKGEGEKTAKEEEEMEHGEEADRLMASSDTDGDGSLSKAEVLAGLAAFAGSAATNYGDSVGVHDEL